MLIVEYRDLRREEIPAIWEIDRRERVESIFVAGPGGLELFALARGEAKARGAARIYVSATPSERTVRFYLAGGCKVLAEPDQRLFELEPEDIHLLCEV